MRRHESLDYVDVCIGIVGFFAFAFFVVTVVSELTGADALGWALTLFAFVLVLIALVLVRRRMVERHRRIHSSAETSADVE